MDNMITGFKKSIKKEMINNISSYFIDVPPIRKYEKKFMEEHQKEIDRAAQKMIDDYQKDGDLHELANREGDWVREYMGKIFRDIQSLPGYYDP